MTIFKDGFEYPANTFTTVDTNMGSGPTGAFCSIAIGGGGYPVISYRDNSNTTLKVAACGDVNCSKPGRLSRIKALFPKIKAHLLTCFPNFSPIELQKTIWSDVRFKPCQFSLTLFRILVLLRNGRFSLVHLTQQFALLGRFFLNHFLNCNVAGVLPDRLPPG